MSLFTIAPDSVLARSGMADRHTRAWRFALINLVWSFWIIAVPLLNSIPLRDWLPATALSYAAFLWFYLRAYTVPARETWQYVPALAALGFLMAPLNWGGMVYIIYACVFSAFSFRSARASVLVMMLTVLAFMAEARWLNWSWPNTLSVAFWALAVGGMNLMYRAKGRADVQLRLSHDEIRRLAASAERERIGRDLHDLLGHTLSLVALKSELAARLVERDAAAAAREMREVERVARAALAEVRNAVSGLRAPKLMAELAAARLLLETAGIHVDNRIAATNLPEALDAALAMVLRESATNILRHAQATRVVIHLEQDATRVRLCIRDDGRGGIAREGNGLAGMRERLTALGGALTIDAPAGRGTHLRAELPLQRSAHPIDVLQDGARPVDTAIPDGALPPADVIPDGARPRTDVIPHSAQLLTDVIPDGTPPRTAVIPDGAQRRAGIQVSAPHASLDPRLRGDDGRKPGASRLFDAIPDGAHPVDTAIPHDAQPSANVIPHTAQTLANVIPHGAQPSANVIPDGAQRRAGIQVSAPHASLDPRLRGDDEGSELFDGIPDDVLPGAGR
jgi:two-component system sensor histidine kinase DesK